ncbi:MAG: hypothetical protein INQ03_10305 [Candidatus Heimdallarchaeota archaeon]|nr:hypothetical protein [Candidatus Heimdallarchaeota archaeon]
MSIEAKIQGTRYVVQLTHDGISWILNLMINNIPEESIKLKNASMREITEGVDYLINEIQVVVNPFQKEMMIKELYGKASGDTNLEAHKQQQAEYKKKEQMVHDEDFRKGLVSEYKQTFKIEAEPAVKKEKTKVKKPEKPEVKQYTQMTTEMKSMVSELNQNIEAEPQPQFVKHPTYARTLQQQYDPVDTRVSAVDVDDMLRELIQTKDLLKAEIELVWERMAKLEQIILKLSTLSGKL